jgi:2-dehydropantoate 2-reductase
MSPNSESPNIVVLGAGAVGCYFGGMLARAGHKVTLVARAEHVAAITDHGLHMDCKSFQEYVAVSATIDLAAVSQADLILLCVKSPDTTKTIKAIAPYLQKHTAILSLQNGVDNCERIRVIVGNPVFPAVVYVATIMAGPGRLKHLGRGELAIGQLSDQQDSAGVTSQLAKLAQLMTEADVPCAVSPDIRKDQWSKFLVNCSYNAISAIGQLTYGEMVQTESIRLLINQLADEVVSVAQHQGIALTLQEARQVNDMIPQTMPGQLSSTAQDLARHKPSEIEYLNGLIVRKGTEYGIPTPANQSVYALVKMLEDAQAQRNTGI